MNPTKKDVSLSMVALVTFILALLLSITASGQTIEQVRNELHRQRVPHPEIVLAQARLETGNFTSSLCKVKGNLFGIKHDGRYAAYRHWRESIADYKKRISSRYKQGENYYAFLRRINYAEDGNYFRKLDKIIRTSK